MLTAFSRSRDRNKRHQDEQLAKESADNPKPAVVLPADNEQAIEFALGQRSLSLLQQVIARGGSLDNIVRTKTPLMRAVQNDDGEAVTLLLAAGAAINLKTRSGECALQLAVREHKQQALEALLKSPSIEQKALQWALQRALQQNQIEMFCMLAKHLPIADKFTVDAVHQYLFKAIKKRDLTTINKLLKIECADVRSLIQKHTLVYWGMKSNDVAIARSLLLASLFRYGVPLSKIILRQNYFNTIKKCREFYFGAEPVSYLESHKLSEPVTIAALRILDVSKKVVEQDKAKLLKSSESAMEDKAVRRANQHFNQNVQPHFAKEFAALGLVEIEKRIRQLILASIRSHAEENFQKSKEKHQEKIITFIDKNHAALVNAEIDAMKDSLNYFTGSESAQAAWRGYNPFAPVSGIWSNLYTRPAQDSEVFSTNAAIADRKINSHEASDIVRERTAYYYLAVVDINEGDDIIRQNRIANFIGLLAEIRNAHKRDDPSCFPGYLTRISQMGNYHSKAELQDDSKAKLAQFFKHRVFQAFKDQMKELSFDERQTLLRALVDLNHETALSIIKNPDEYPQKLLSLRQAFIDALGNEIDLLTAFNTESSAAMDVNDLIYIQQYLIDITRGSIALALEEYVKRLADRPATLLDVLELNPYNEEQPEQKLLFNDLLTVIHKNSVFYRHSFHQLRAAATYFENKIYQLNNNSDPVQTFKDLTDSLECEEEAIPVITQAWQTVFHSFNFAYENNKIQNPYLAQLSALQQQLTHTGQPLIVLQLQKRLPTLQSQIELFDKVVDFLGHRINTIGQQQDVIELIAATVEYTIFHERFDRTAFEQEWFADHTDESLVAQYFECFNEIDYSESDPQLLLLTAARSCNSLRVF